MSSTDIKGPFVVSNPIQTSATSKPSKQQPGAGMATIHDDDERLLAEIGYEQVSSII